MQTRKEIAEKFGVHPITVAVWASRPGYGPILKRHEHKREAGVRFFYTYNNEVLKDLAEYISQN
jgi:uncharacterized protein YjcR